MILVVLVLRSSNSGSSGSTSSTTISSITTWGPYHGGGPLTRNTKPYILGLPMPNVLFEDSTGLAHETLPWMKGVLMVCAW